jgi:hypothetical protein
MPGQLPQPASAAPEKKKPRAVSPRGHGNQYSSGRRMQVEDLSASVTIQSFVPSRSR